VIGNRPVARLDEDKRHRKIDYYRCNRKKDIDTCVFDFMVFEMKQWHGTFDNPEKSDTAHQNHTAVNRGNGFEIVYDGFH
jgi:hypothetical protein